jgi:hypothetical protein
MGAMDFNEYLRQCGFLYVEAVVSGIDGGILRRLGGSIAIAGHHTENLWTQKNAYLGFIDRTREQKEVRPLAAQRWRMVRNEIAQEVAAGRPPTKALEEVMQRYGTSPHTILQVQSLGEKVWDPTGGPASFPWIVDLRIVQEHFRRSSATMTNTFGALFTAGYLIATAKDWQHATPEEWDKALKVGEIGVTLGEVAGGVAGMKQARDASRAAGASAQAARPVAAATAPAKPGPTKPAGLAFEERGTKARGAAPQASGCMPAARAAAPVQRGTTGRLVTPVADPSNVDEAMREDSAYGRSAAGKKPGQATIVERPRHRTGPNAGQAYAPLDAISGGMTGPQRRAVSALIGRFPTKLRALWSQANNTEAQHKLIEVGRLWRSSRQADRDAAKTMARKEVYDLWRGRFWTRVSNAIQRDAELRQQFAGAGLEFDPTDKSKAPFWRLPNGTTESLTVDHFASRIQDDPTRCVDEANLMLSPSRENTRTNEAVRNYDQFQTAR